MKHAFIQHHLMRRARVAFAGIATGTLVFAIAAPVTAAIVDVGASAPISVNVPATASSTDFPPLEPNAAEANDGNTGTRWASAQGDADATPWIRYDLTQACIVTGASVNWEGAYASTYTLVGWTGSEWEAFRSITNGAAGPVDLADFEDLGLVQYVALVVDEKATPWGASIWELQFQGRDCVASSQDAPTAEPPSYASSGGDTGGGDDGDDGGTDPGHTRGDLLSLGKPVTASSEENPGTAAPGINDGDPTTRWGSAHRDGEFVVIDLQGHATVDTIEIDHDPAAFIVRYVIETSPNGWEWTEYASIAGATGADTTHIAPGGAVDGVRFVRLTALERGTPWGNSIYELSVYGTGFVALAPPSAEGARGVLLSYLKPGTTSTEQDDAQCAGCTVANLFDRNTTTRWATDPGETWEGNPSWDGTAWVQVDLGAPAVVQQIALHWDPAFATAYNVFIADEATGPWRQIYGTSTGDGVRDVFDIDDEPGRHVRLEMNERAWVWGAQYGYSLYEFRVYGTGGDPITPPPLPQDPDFGDLELVWSDEFSGAAGTAADPGKWVSDPSATWTVNNRELQLYTDGTHNVRHDGQGNLVIEAKRENYKGAQLYTSGRINTSQTFHGQYGRYEARIKVPQGQGLWPAFWMMGASFLEGTPWPSNGEIDIMEVLGHDTQTTHTTIHGPGYSGMGGVGGGHHAGVDLSADFHVYGVDWDSTGLTYTLDGAPIFRIDREDVEEGRGQNWVYDQPFYMILNLAVGGEWPGNPDEDTPFPSSMLVDYVRVWQSPGSGEAQVMVPAGGGVPPAGGGTPPALPGAGAPTPGRIVTVYVTPEPQPAPSEEPSAESAPQTASDPDVEDGPVADGGAAPSEPGPGETVEAEPVPASSVPFTSVLPWLLGATAGVLAGVGGSWFAWRRGL